jgi:signal transduction histidine kinase
MVRTEVVERLGGEVSFVSQVGAGTTFTVRLPIHRDPAVAGHQGGQP